MITLTTPANINSVLGGNVPVAYNRLVLSPSTMDPQTLLITGVLKLTSSAVPTMQAITGSLTINNSSGVLEIAVQQLDFYRRIQLSGPQITSVNTIIGNAQNALESGLVSLGVIAGTQSAGA
jgi:hypothetical protein